MKRLFLLLAFAATAAAAKPVDVPVVYYRLGNGLKVVVSEAHAAPTVTVAVYYGIGFRVEPKGQTGFAHLFEHMMFQGSAHVKKFEHAKIVESNGGVLNGSTRLDFTNYFETLPSNAVETALWLEADRMRSLEVTEENLKNQQNVVSEEIRVNVLNQPYALFEWLDIWQNANQNWFNAHNFYGDLHDLEAAKIADVPAFALAYHIADHDSPDFAPTVLLNLILQGDDSSRLFQRLVKEKAISLDWAGGINFELGNEFDYDGPMLMVSRATYKPGHTGEEILKEVDAVVRDLQEHGVTKKELDAAKVRFRSNVYSQLESTFGKANLLASFALFNDDPRRINKVVALYDAVTPEQIKSVAQRTLTPENRTSIDRVPEKKEAK